LSNHYFQKQIWKGREPLFDGVKERVIRLAGSKSDVTEFSINKYGHHIIPVFETYENKKLIQIFSKNFRVPVY